MNRLKLMALGLLLSSVLLGGCCATRYGLDALYFDRGRVSSVYHDGTNTVVWLDHGTSYRIPGGIYQPAWPGDYVRIRYDGDDGFAVVREEKR